MEEEWKAMPGIEIKKECLKKNDSNYIWMIIFIVLSVLWMGIIYTFSAQTGEESSGISNNIAAAVCRIFSMELSDSGFDTLAFVIRKFAHFTEYAILGVFYTMTLVLWERFVKSRLWIATGLCCVYAITDELHQSFSDGRTPAVRDIAIDTIGGLSGGAVCLLILFTYTIIKRKKEKRNCQ